MELGTRPCRSPLCSAVPSRKFVCRINLLSQHNAPQSALLRKRGWHGCLRHFPRAASSSSAWAEDDDDYFLTDELFALDDDDYGDLLAQAPKAADTVPPPIGDDGSDGGDGIASSRALRRVACSLREMPTATADAVRVTSEAAASVLNDLASDAAHAVRSAAQSAADHAATGQVQRHLRRVQTGFETSMAELPEGFWGKLMWLWDLPPIKRIRIGVGVANLGIKIPALLVLLATQGQLLASQVTLPMLAPLLLGSGMVLRSVQSNASYIFPRMGILVVFLWVLWFFNGVVQNTVAYLRRQGAVDDRVGTAVVTACECAALLAAGVIVLAIAGVNVPALLLPAGIALAIASKDASHNFVAGFFLFVVQPFRVGDTVAVTCAARPNPPPAPAAPHAAAPYSGGGVNGTAAAAMAVPSGPGWFEGTCEKVDLRYTILRNGRRRLHVPNSAFLTREFMVLEEEVVGEEDVGPPPPTHRQRSSSSASVASAAVRQGQQQVTGEQGQAASDGAEGRWPWWPPRSGNANGGSSGDDGALNGDGVGVNGDSSDGGVGSASSVGSSSGSSSCNGTCSSSSGNGTTHAQQQQQEDIPKPGREGPVESGIISAGAVTPAAGLPSTSSSSSQPLSPSLRSHALDSQ